MSQLIVELPHVLRDGRRRYVALVYGEARRDGRLEAWFEFADLRTGDRALTGVETTQRDLAQLLRWASSLTPAYLEGAYARAVRRFGKPSPARFARALAADRGAQPSP